MNYPFAPVILLLFFGLLGCDSNDAVTDGGEIAEIQMLQDSVAIEVGEVEDFSVVGLTASGDTVHDPDLDLRWWSTDTTVFTVDDTGLAVARNEGTAFCMVEVTGLSKAARFVGRDSASVIVMLF